MNAHSKPDQHHPLSAQEEIRAHIRRAIRALEAIEADIPSADYMTIPRQRETAAAYLDRAKKIANAAFDCTLEVSAIAASMGNDERFNVKACRAAMNDVLGDELHDAREWASEVENEDA